jgi:hypothetical protein
MQYHLGSLHHPAAPNEDFLSACSNELAALRISAPTRIGSLVFHLSIYKKMLFGGLASSFPVASLWI